MNIHKSLSLSQNSMIWNETKNYHIVFQMIIDSILYDLYYNLDFNSV